MPETDVLFIAILQLTVFFFKMSRTLELFLFSIWYDELLMLRTKEEMRVSSTLYLLTSDAVECVCSAHSLYKTLISLSLFILDSLLRAAANVHIFTYQLYTAMHNNSISLPEELFKPGALPSTS